MMKVDTKSEAAAGRPPYIPFETLTGFVDGLKKTTVPTHIDKSMMGKIAGGLQTYLLACLRFMGLTEGKNNEVTPALEKLVEAHGTEGYKPALAEIVKAAYAPVIGKIDLAKATAKQLDDAFGHQKLDGVVRDRAIRFYLKALKMADIQVSPLLGARKPKGSGSSGSAKPRKPKAADTSKPASGGRSDVEKPREPADGMVEFPIPIGGDACIRVPQNITTKQLPLVRAILAQSRRSQNRIAAKNNDETGDARNGSRKPSRTV